MNRVFIGLSKFNFHRILLNSILINLSASLKCAKSSYRYWNTQEKDGKTHPKKEIEMEHLFIYWMHCNARERERKKSTNTHGVIITWSEQHKTFDLTWFDSTQITIKKRVYVQFSDFYNTYKNDLISIARFWCDVVCCCCCCCRLFLLLYAAKMTGQISHGFGCIPCLSSN